MKLTKFYIFFWSTILLIHCHPWTKAVSPTSVDNTKIFILDSTLQDSISRQIQFISARHFSQFKTPIEFRFFSNNLLTDSIVQPDFAMMSWYSNKKDTLELVAHVGDFETAALLIRFIKDTHSVFFFRAPHLEQNYFRLNKADTFCNQIEVPPTRYTLQLSKVPDTTNKSVVFGHIDMESSDYFDKRDTLQNAKRVQMKFYFRSQFRKFD